MICHDSNQSNCRYTLLTGASIPAPEQNAPIAYVPVGPALRVKVTQGDDADALSEAWGSNDRNEILVTKETTSGPSSGFYGQNDEHYYGASFYIPDDGTFPDPPCWGTGTGCNQLDYWHVIMQFHSLSQCDDGGPNIALIVKRNDTSTGFEHGTGYQLILSKRDVFESDGLYASPTGYEVATKAVGQHAGTSPYYSGGGKQSANYQLWPWNNSNNSNPSTAILRKGEWHSVILHVRWSVCDNVTITCATGKNPGLLELWLDGSKVYPQPTGNGTDPAGVTADPVNRPTLSTFPLSTNTNYYAYNPSMCSGANAASLQCQNGNGCEDNTYSSGGADPIFLSTGMYRNNALTGTDTIYWADLWSGQSYASVDPTHRTCVSTTCNAQGDNCGTIPDGCGGQLTCGTCSGGQTCGGGGTANVCGGSTCTPTTCAAQGKNCGSISDSCGSQLTCGTCSGVQTCGGGGTANVCGGTGTGGVSDTLWTDQVGTSSDEYGYGITADSSGNVYVAGYTLGGLDFANQGGRDAFVQKYGATGTKTWGRQLGAAGDEQANGVAVDTTGNVYLGGSTTDAVGGSGAYNGGDHDGFLAKYDSTGTRKWVVLVGTSGDDIVNALAADSSGNIYIAGYTAGNLSGTNAGGLDAFLAKYDTSGNQTWIRQLGTSADDVANGIAVDSSGNVFVAGYTTGSLVGTNSGGQDLFFAKYNSSGTQQWKKQIGTSADDVAWAVATDSFSNVYIAGSTTGSLAFNNAGGLDAFLYKYDSSGTYVWSSRLLKNA